MRSAFENPSRRRPACVRRRARTSCTSPSAPRTPGAPLRARRHPSDGSLRAWPDATARRYPQPQEPPQQPPPLARGAEGATLTFAAPCTAKVENCFKTFPAPHSGQTTAWSPERTNPRSAIRTPCRRTRRSACAESTVRSRVCRGAARRCYPPPARYPETELEQSMIERIGVVGAGGRVGCGERAPRRARRAPRLRRARARSPLRARSGDRRGRRCHSARPWVAHVSGATPLSALDPHARRFGMHPLQSFSKTRGPEQLDGAWAAVSAESDEARTTGFWLAETLGLRPFALADDARAAYHAGAAVASNYLVTLREAAGSLLASAGAPPEALEPLMRGVIDNGFEHRRSHAATGRPSSATSASSARRARSWRSCTWCSRGRQLRSPAARGQVTNLSQGDSAAPTVCRTIDGAPRRLARRRSTSVGLVPTMGSLHGGHLLSSAQPAPSARRS